MDEKFVAHMQGAIDTAPHEAVARQLDTLLTRLKATDGTINPHMPMPTPMPE